MSEIPLIQVSEVPKPVDRSANKPVYILKTEDSEAKGKVQYYYVLKLNKSEYYVSFSGFEITKAQAEKIRNEPSAKLNNLREINHEVPWVKVIRIENVTYKQKAQGETK